MMHRGLETIGRREFLQGGIALGAISAIDTPFSASQAATGQEDRRFWLQLLTKVSSPVLQALSERRLKEVMSVEAPHGNRADRQQYTYLEALGRTLMGIAPWLESGPTVGPEGKLRSRSAELARMAIDAGTDPVSPDFMNFTDGGQPVVDAAFLALAVLRAPNELWGKLSPRVQKNMITALESSRRILPAYSNWLLFSAMIEAALSFMGAWWDPVRVDYAVRSFETWYKGDGVYGDGPDFHWDYYNSFVIQPMLLMILGTISKSSSAWDRFYPSMLLRAQRYAAIQERLIGPDGTFSPIGRSLCYRFGVFHLLADIALRRKLPEEITPAQVRTCLTAVMHRMGDAPGTFDEHGWLTVGFYGHQPTMAESYISTGSCYLCSAVFLPLGLPENDAFWSAPAMPWTSKRIWAGEPVGANHALQEVRTRA